MLDLSIIIPVFNRQALCERAIRSAVAQNVPQTEIIVVDDFSQPPFALPSDLAGQAIHVIRHDRNLGAAAARNTGIAAARGDWLLFLDSDDHWLPATLQPRLAQAKQIQAAAADDLVAFVAGFTLVDSADSRHETRIPRGSNDPLHFASGCWFSPGSTLLVRKDVFAAVGLYDASLPRLEDLDWFLRLALAGGRLERWPHAAAVIELGGKPSLIALEQAGRRLMEKYGTAGGPLNLAPAHMRRLKAYLDIERASIHAAHGRWGKTAYFIARSQFRAPRTTLQLERFWD